MSDQELVQPSTFELTGVNIESVNKVDKPVEFQKVSPPPMDSKESELQKISLKVSHEPPKQSSATIQTPGQIPIRKEISTVLKTTVQFASKKDEKSDRKAEISSKLAPVKQPSAKKSNIRSSTSNSSLPRNLMKIERLKSVLDEIKSAKKDIKKTSSATGIRAFPEVYEQRIVEDYNKLYSSKDKKNIFGQLKLLEKNKFLQLEMMNKETRSKVETELDKQKCNFLAHKIRLQEKKLFQLEETLMKVEGQLPQDTITELYEAKVQEEKDLIASLEKQKITSDSLSNMCQDRKSLVLYVKKKCTEIMDELKEKNVKFSMYSNSKNKREEKKRELFKNISKYSQISEKFSTDRLGPRFTDLLNDELSIFEEGRAVREIFRHEEELEKEQERKEEEERRAEFQRQKAKRDKELDETRKKRRLVEEQLKEKRADFEKLRDVTRIPEVRLLPSHKTYLEECTERMNYFNEILTRDVAEVKQEIANLDQELKDLKFNAKTGSEQREIKIDHLEKQFIDEQNHLEDMTNSVEKSEKVIDEVCTAISRILYQLQGKPNVI